MSNSDSYTWRKLGLVFDARTQLPAWADNSALTPLPTLHADGQIRVYAGFRDKAGVSRIGYVDVDSKDPTRILRVSKRPVLDVGRDGCFDDNGVILGDIVRHEGRLLLFYVGFQLVAKAKFIALSGLAASDDEGESFTRVFEGPFVGRADGQNMVAAIHTARYEDGKWRFWLGAGDGWEVIDGKPFPQYGVRYLESPRLEPIARSAISCIEPTRPEYRAGRPRVYKTGDSYLMHFTRGNVQGDYTPARAFSADGVSWRRDDSPFDLQLSPTGWDSRHLCYPSIVQAGDRRFMFYDGNNMGLDGFGCAVAERAD